MLSQIENRPAWSPLSFSLPFREGEGVGSKAKVLAWMFCGFHGFLYFCRRYRVVMGLGYYIYRCWCRLCRIGHSRGFGIQSPLAYQLVTDVLCQRNPYYLYDDLKSLCPQLRGTRLRICQMLLRLSNAQQSATTYVDDHLPKEYMAFVKAGNRKSRFVDSPDGSSFILLSADHQGDIERILESAHEATILFLDKIYGCRDAVERWKTVVGHPRVSMSFDLFDCGVAVLAHSLQKANYKLNL